jgi:hypothetical protein
MPVASSPAPDPSPAAGARTGSSFYRYRDAQGQMVAVDSLARVPAQLRGSAELVGLAPEARPGSPASAFARELHGPSFLAGALATLVVGALLLALRRRAQRLVRMAVLLGLVLLGAGLYFGWVQRSAGQSSDLFSSPKALIEDARSAVEKMNQRTREQQEVLQDLERETTGHEPVP